MERTGVTACTRAPLVVQGFVEDRSTRSPSFGQYGVVDHVARFDASDRGIGYGLHEHGFWGAFAKYGMNDAYGGAA